MQSLQIFLKISLDSPTSFERFFANVCAPDHLAGWENLMVISPNTFNEFESLMFLRKKSKFCNLYFKKFQNLIPKWPKTVASISYL